MHKGNPKNKHKKERKERTGMILRHDLRVRKHESPSPRGSPREVCMFCCVFAVCWETNVLQ
jgi:hypothetical protein